VERRKRHQALTVSDFRRVSGEKGIKIPPAQVEPVIMVHGDVDLMTLLRPDKKKCTIDEEALARPTEHYRN
jgi:hypothetical protein